MLKGPGLLGRIALATRFWRLRGVTEQSGGVSIRTQHYFSWFGLGKMALPMGGGTPANTFQGELSRYSVIQSLTKGGMADVFLAKSPGGVKVVLKFLPIRDILAQFAEYSLKDQTQIILDMIMRFEREYAVGKLLNHEALVRTLDSNIYLVFPGLKMNKNKFKQTFNLRQAMATDPIFIATEHLTARPGSTQHAPALGPEIRGGMSESQVIALFLPLLRALAYAHFKGIYHRDLKPDNILVTSDRRGNLIPKIIDFGIARSKERATNITRFGHITGTPSYLAPNPYRDAAREDVRASAQIDIYQMGIIILEFITGVNPFEKMDHMYYWSFIAVPKPIDVSGIHSPELRRVVARMLSPHREDNYGLMSEVVGDLELIMQRRR